MAGRPTKYTPEKAKTITDAISIGATYRLACLYAGISDDTMTRWLARYADFAEQVRIAEGKAAVQALATIQRAARDDYDWRAVTWLLERRFPNDYGKRDRVDVTMTVRQEVERLVAAGVIEADEAEAAIAEAELIVRGRG